LIAAHLLFVKGGQNGLKHNHQRFSSDNFSVWNHLSSASHLIKEGKMDLGIITGVLIVIILVFGIIYLAHRT
jgi:hypothetical protein